MASAAAKSICPIPFDAPPPPPPLAGGGAGLAPTDGLAGIEGFGFGLGAGGGPLEPIIDVGREFAGDAPLLDRPFGFRPFEAAATGGGALLGAAGAGGGGGADSTSFKLIISLLPSLKLNVTY